MGRYTRRSHREDSQSSTSTNANPKKKHHSSSASNYETHRDSRQKEMGKSPIFVSYLETPNLPPKVKLLCEILANTPSVSVEKVLDDTGVQVSPADVEEVLKLSYGFPGPAVKFFRWAGYQLSDRHSPYAWNLVVDLLGKNNLFDAMWDAIKSMRKEGLVSLATFASVFSSYVDVNRVQEAIMTFEVMDQYDCPRNIVALNSLLSAICREGKTQKAKEFLGVAKDKIRLDADSYAILLEGWANEGNVFSARETFAEMVMDIGWDPRNVPAYDTFLTTLLTGPDGLSATTKFLTGMKDRGCYPGMKFVKVALEECVSQIDLDCARLLWDLIVGVKGCGADTEMYNSMIALYCYTKNTDKAKSLLDEMVYNGAFPDSQTYNLLFQFLIKIRKLKEASSIFNEMVKNEFVPSHANCCLAVKSYMDIGDPNMAIKVWKCIVENYDSELHESGNLLIVGLRDINRLPEAVKYADCMIDQGIKLYSSTLSKLKQSLAHAKKGSVYDELLRKWKAH